jgi:ABC-type Zn uptake system ZnuABC Zn-binding protein ZnuA
LADLQVGSALAVCPGPSEAGQERSRHVLGWLALSLLCAALTACTASTPDGESLVVRPDLRNADGNPLVRVVATTTQIADLARNVGGELVHVDAILSANVDPHDFTLGPGDLQRIAFADVILVNGAGLEDTWMGPLVHADRHGVLVMVSKRGARRVALPASTASYGPGWGELIIPVAVTSIGVKLLPGGRGAPQGDPHIWLAVPNAVQMALNIRDALISVAPPYASYYKANAARYVRELDALDKDIVRQITLFPRSQRTLVTCYGGLGYYATRYGLTLVDLSFPCASAGMGASSQDTLIAQLRREHVKTIVLEASMNHSVGEQIGRDAGTRVVTDLYGEALGLPGSAGDTYIKMMRHNTEVIVSALTSLSSATRVLKSSSGLLGELEADRRGW